MKQNLIAFCIIAGILAFVGLVYYFLKPDYNYTQDLKVVETWELPFSLREVSGISHIDDSTLACIQDEDGILFIYDLVQKKVIDEIEFGPRGDYESIRILDSTAYVMESGGEVYKITNFNSEKRQVETFSTKFSSFNDIESMDYLAESDEFLTVPKENNLLNNRKEFIIYRLDPETFALKEEYFTSLSYDHPIFNTNTSWFVDQGFLPSELTIHPFTREIYILDSRIPKLLILHPDGRPKKLYMLNPEEFQQPEGLSFDSEGKMYISNEESDFQKQNIQLVEFN